MALPTTAAPHHTTTCPHDAAQLPAPPRDAPPSNNHPRPPARIRARRPKAPRTAAGVDPGAPPPSTPRGCWEVSLSPQFGSGSDLQRPQRVCCTFRLHHGCSLSSMRGRFLHQQLPLAVGSVACSSSIDAATCVILLL
ncbi:uncharacterized protein LOC119363531 isoform X1 [Triticum dicoccoides]|uniref:uncharacterized protein LOC119363531 isoform X1 n=1 Tax=Triticum dicoccoides TaxID=85692 RepID=UPI00188FDA17|nr:uncharacterized protein LOC119363531 isoform X1 [Triticum dicoccoides]